MRTAILLALALSALCAALPREAGAQHCGGPANRARVVIHQAYHAPVRVAAVVAADHDFQKVVLVPKAVRVLANPDYYYTVGDSYKDNLLADAVAFRVLNSLRGKTAPGPVAGPGEAAPAMGKAEASTARPSAPTAVDAKLKAVVEASCVKCHAGKNGIDLSDLSTLARVDRLNALDQILTGEMPKGGKPVSDDEVLLFRQWARSAK